MASVLGMPGGKQLQQTPYVPIENKVLDTRSSWTKALDRGVSQSRALQGAFANAVGEATGIDALAEWGEERMDSYLEEIQNNPPEVHAWDDIDGLAAFGTYVAERVGEQLPALGSQIAMYGAGVLVGGVAGKARGAMAGARTAKGAAETVAKQSAAKMKAAQLGKAVKRKVGNKGFEAFKTTQAQKVMGMAGATAAGAIQNIGESQMNFIDADIDSPGNAILTGLSKAALDMVGFERLIRASNITGQSPQKLLQAASAVVKETRNNALVEGVTEGMQTAIDQMAVAALSDQEELFTKGNLKEIVDSMIAGATVSGVLTPAMASAGAMSRYAQDKAAAFEDFDFELEAHDFTMPDEPDFAPRPSGKVEDNPDPIDLKGDDESVIKQIEGDDVDAQLREQFAERDVAEGFDESTIEGTEAPSITKPENMPSEIADEPDADLTAQFDVLSDPSSTKHSMFVPMGNLTQLDEDTVLDTPGIESVIVKIGDQLGTVYTNTQKNDNVFAEINSKGGELSQEDIGAILYDRPGKATDSDGTAVIVRDRGGNVVSHVNSAPETLQSDVDTMRGHKPHDGTVEITDATKVIDERGAKVDEEVQKRTKPQRQAQAVQTAENLVTGQVKQAYDQRIAEANERLGAATQAREAYRKALDETNTKLRVVKDATWRKPVDKNPEMEELTRLREFYSGELRNASRSVRDSQSEISSTTPPEPTPRMKQDMGMLGKYLEKHASAAELSQAEAAAQDMSGSGNRITQQLLENAFKWAETAHPASVPGKEKEEDEQVFTADNVLSAPHRAAPDNVLDEYDARARAVEGRRNALEGPDTGGYDQAVDRFDESMTIDEDDVQDSNYVIRAAANSPNESDPNLDPERRRLGRGYSLGRRDVAQKVLDEWNEMHPDANVDRHLIRYKFQDGEERYLIREAQITKSLATQEYGQGKYTPTTKYTRPLAVQSEELAKALKEVEDLRSLLRDDSHGRSLDAVTNDAIDQAKEYGDRYRFELSQLMQRYEQDVEAASRDKDRWTKDEHALNQGIKDFYTLGDEILPHDRRRRFEQELARLNGAVIYATPPGKAKNINLTKKAKDVKKGNDVMTLEEKSLLAQGHTRYRPEKKPVPLSTATLTKMGMSQMFAHKTPTQRAAGSNYLEGYTQALWSLVERGWKLDVRGGPYNASVEVGEGQGGKGKTGMNGKRLPQLRGDTLLKHGYLLGGLETADQDMSVKQIHGEYIPNSRVKNPYTQFMRSMDTWMKGNMKGEPPNPIRAYRGTLEAKNAGFNVLTRLDKAIGAMRDQIALVSMPLAHRQAEYDQMPDGPDFVGPSPPSQTDVSPDMYAQGEKDKAFWKLRFDVAEHLEPLYERLAQLYSAHKKQSNILRSKFPSDPYWAAGTGRGIQEVTGWEEHTFRDGMTPVPDEVIKRSGRGGGSQMIASDSFGIQETVPTSERLSNLSEKYDDPEKGATYGYLESVTDSEGLDTQLAIQTESDSRRTERTNKGAVFDASGNKLDYSKMDKSLDNATRNVFVDANSEAHVPKKLPALLRELAQQHNLTDPVVIVSLDNIQLGDMNAAVQRTFEDPSVFARAYTGKSEDGKPVHHLVLRNSQYVRGSRQGIKAEEEYMVTMSAGAALLRTAATQHRDRIPETTLKRMKEAYRRDKKKTPVASWMDADRGFANWFSDKLSHRMRNILDAPTDIQDRALREIAIQMRASWSKMLAEDGTRPTNMLLTELEKHTLSELSRTDQLKLKDRLGFVGPNPPPQTDVNPDMYAQRKHVDEVINDIARAANAPPQRGRAQVQQIPYGGDKFTKDDNEVRITAGKGDRKKQADDISRESRGGKALGYDSPQHHRRIRLSLQRQVKRARRSGRLNGVEVVYLNKPSELTEHMPKRAQDDLKALYALMPHPEIDDALQPTIFVVTSNLQNEKEALAALRHEALGHMNLRGIAKEARKELLRRISAARDVPGIKQLYEEVDAIYSTNMSDQRRAEEVLSKVAESVDAIGKNDLSTRARNQLNRIRDFLIKLMRRIGLVPNGDLTETEIQNVIKEMAGIAPLSKRARQTAKDAKHYAKQESKGFVEDVTSFKDVVYQSYTVDDNAPLTGAQRMQSAIRRAFNNAPKVNVLSAVASRQSVVNAISPNVGARLYQRSQSNLTNKSSVPYTTGVQRETAAWTGQLTGLLHGKGAPEVRLAFDQLAKEIPYSRKSPLAKDITNLLDTFGDYLVDNVGGFDKIANYFPRTYNRQEIIARYDEFNQILETHDPKGEWVTEKTAEAILGLAAPVYTFDSAITDEASFQKERTITGNPGLIDALVNAGFLNSDPEISVRAYMERAIRRAEMERVFGMEIPTNLNKLTPELAKEWLDMSNAQRKASIEDFNIWDQLTAREKALEGEVPPPFEGSTYYPDGYLKVEMRTLPKRDADRLQKAVHGSVLLTNIDRDSTAYKVLDEIRAYESFRVLLGSGLASIPEMAGIFARAKGTPGMTHFAHTLLNTVSDRGNTEQLRELAHYIGVIRKGHGAAMATEMTSNEGQGSGPFSRNLGKLFKWNGNDKIVEFSRIAAISVGMEFLHQQAAQKRIALKRAPEGHVVYGEDGKVNPYPDMSKKDIQDAQNAHDWLGELGITDPEDVLIHIADGSPLWSSDAGDTAQNNRARQYADALNTFVNESVINPNAAERPGYSGSLPGMMIFHLRSFMYSFNQVIVGGVARELDRVAERGLGSGGSAMLYMLPALPFMMAAVAMFLFLGGISDELRQRLFTFGERGSLDAAQGRVDKMLGRWGDRAGFGQLPMYDVLTEPDMNSAMYELGPTAHHVYTMQDMLTKDDPQVLRAVMKSTPILSQLPTTRREIYQLFDEEAPDIAEEQAEEDKYASSRS